MKCTSSLASAFVRSIIHKKTNFCINSCQHPSNVECRMNYPLQQICCIIIFLYSTDAFFSPWTNYITAIKNKESGSRSQMLQRPSSVEERKRSLVKRDASEEGEEGGEDGEVPPHDLQLSITANFYALQQKLRQELWRRSNQVCMYQRWLSSWHHWIFIIRMEALEVLGDQESSDHKDR